jgi:hypothetical protein
MFGNVLAYRLVAGKLAIIFQFYILFPENPKTPISAETPQ